MSGLRDFSLSVEVFRSVRLPARGMSVQVVQVVRLFVERSKCKVGEYVQAIQ